jgi:Phosphatidylethanolamine-binding protein
MFCNSDSWDSAICLSPEPCSRPLVMEAFYFLYSPFPLFTGVRGRRVLGSSLSSGAARRRLRVRHEAPEDGIEGALEGINDFGRRGYDGCMPPQGHGVHHYHFKVYALDAELDAPAGLSKDELLAAMGGSILDEGELVGTYER